MKQLLDTLWNGSPEDITMLILGLILTVFIIRLAWDLFIRDL